MKRIVIEIAEEGDPSPGYDVVTEDGRRCDGLAWDEMLGQVVALTHPRLGGEPQYRMLTAEQWGEGRQRGLYTATDCLTLTSRSNP